MKIGDDIVNYKVVYFTRTGNSKRVAEKIANMLSCEALQITDNMNWKGGFGYLKGGYYASLNRDVEITIPENLDSADELIVVTPMWAGGIAPDIKAFLKSTTLDKVHLVVTYINSKLKDRVGFKSVTDIAKNKNDEDVIISNLVSDLTTE